MSRPKRSARPCRILGFEDVHFLGVDDSVLLVDAAIIRRLASLFRELRPDIVLTHYPFEHAGLGDHAVTGQMVVRALGHAAGVDPGDRNSAASGLAGLLLRAGRRVGPQRPL